MTRISRAPYGRKESMTQHRRGNREFKKPKQQKPKIGTVAVATSAKPAAPAKPK